MNVLKLTKCEIMFINNLKTNIIESKKYILIYLAFILISSLSMISANNFAHPKMEIILFAVIAIAGSFCIVYHNSHKQLYKTAFVVLIILGLLLAFIVPICESGDSDEHLRRAELTSRGVLFPEYNGDNFTNYYKNGSNYVWDGSGFQSIDSIQFFTKDRYDTVFTTSHDTDKINHTLVNVNQVFEQNPFFGYLPQSIGVFVAKLLDLNVIWMLWLASICNLVVYSAIVSFAIRKTPIFKVPLFVTACIPLAVFQAASPSIDSIIYSVSILLIAYFFYLYKLNDCTINIKHITKFMALVLFLGMCKLTLFSFVLLIFAVPLKNFKNRNMLIYSIGGIVILGIIGLLWSKFATDSLWHSYRAVHFLKDNINSTQQVEFLLSSPSNILLVLGDVLNQITHVFSPLYPSWPLSNDDEHYKLASQFLSAIIPFFLAFVYMVYPSKEKISTKAKLIAFVVAGLIFFGTCMAEYLTWTPVGNVVIDGTNIRYYIPFFGLLPFIFNINKLDNNIKIKNYVVTLSISFLAGLLLAIGFYFY